MRSPQDDNVTSRLVESLGRAIVTGAYDGAPFPTEAELSQRHGVSRAATREAIKLLTGKGLLHARRRQGTKVQPESRWNLFDPDVLRWMQERTLSLRLLCAFAEMRLAIEPTAASLAAVKAQPADIDAIAVELARMRAAKEGWEDPQAADIGFHLAILRATGNPFYVQLQDVVDAALRLSIRFTRQVQDRGATFADHRRVFDAIVAKDTERARKAMLKLVEDTLQLIRRRIAAGEP